MTHAQPLEPRTLHAAVFAGIPGYYEVTGTSGDDSIAVAVDQAAGTMTLDGVTYGGVLHVTVRAGGGNDTVSVVASGTGFISAAIHGGPGQDTLTLGLPGGAWGEEEHDVITLRNSVRGEAYGGDGDDYISLAGDCFSAQVEGGDGNDILWALDSRAGVVLSGGPGNDRLYGSPFNDVLFDGPGTDFVFGMAGNDEFDSRDGERDWIVGGDGNDTLWCDVPEGGITGCEDVIYG